MRLVWVVIPLVLIGIIGMQESFAENDSENRSQLTWNIQDFYMSNNGDFEISLLLDNKVNVPTETFHTCITCNESITISLNNLNYVTSVVFLEGFSEYREKFFGDSYQIPFTDILALNPKNSQIHYVGNYNTTLAFDTIRDPAEFSKFVWDIHWVQAFEDSDGKIYYQLLKFSISPNLDEHLTTQGTVSITKAIPDYTATTTYDIDGVNTNYIDNWFKENLLNESQIDIENNNEIKTGSFIVERFQYAFKVDYGISSANDVLDIRYVFGGYEFVTILLQSYNDGVITVYLPQSLINPSHCVDNPNYEFDVISFTQRDSLDYTILSEPNAEIVVIEIPFSKHMDEVGVRYIDHYKWNEKSKCSVPEKSEYSKLLPPLKQYRNQVTISDVICKSGFELVSNSKYYAPSCVKPSTAEKLIERGWVRS